jgi:hypothetical protein
MSQLTVQQALSILQLQPGATQQQIRAAYKRLALKLHPDKHQRQPKHPRQQQQQQDAGSIALPADPAAAFSMLSAAYELLSGSHHQPSNGSSSSSTWPLFEAAYASGLLFSDALLDQAVLSGLAPADIAALQQLCAAAASGQLAQQLAQQPPSQAEEQQWRQLYRQLTINWQLEQLKQQQQQQQQQQQPAAAGGVCLVELLSDLLLKPSGEVMVEVSDDEDDQQQQQQSQLSCPGPQPEALSRGRPAAVAVAADCRSCSYPEQQLQGTGSGSGDMEAAASIASCSLQQARQQQQAQEHRQPSACSEHSQQHCQLHKAAQQQQQQQQCLDGSARRQRHGLGFYWMWLRRLLLARAVLSILTSKQRVNYDANLLAVL